MITDHKFKSGCPAECLDDHKDFMCLHYIADGKQCEKRASEHGELSVSNGTPNKPYPTTISFTALGGIVLENCSWCSRNKWLGTCQEGSRMCQSCFHRINGLGPLPSDSM